MKYTIPFVICAVFYFAGGQSLAGDFLTKKIDRIVWVDGGDFASICQQLRVPCGQEHIPIILSKNSRVEYPLHDVRGLQVRGILDQVVSHNPGYRWDYVDGVLIFRPSDGQMSPLDAIVSTFTASSVTTLHAIECLGAATRIGMYSGPVRGVDEGPAQKKLISISAQKKSIRRILNAIVRANGRAMWHYFPGKAGDEDHPPQFDIDFY